MTREHEHQPKVEEDASPSWDELHEIAASQHGVFSVEQAASAGFSNQLLHKHVQSGNLEHVQRGIYRLVRFPASSRGQEDLVVAWLWSGREGVISHESALALHELSDALPANIHLTVPLRWASRRVQVPAGIVLVVADVPENERGWVGAAPVTTPARTIVDVAMAHGDASIVDAAIQQALRRNLVTLVDVAPAVAYLATGLGGWTRVRPEATSGFDNAWRTLHISGTCRVQPPSDWRVNAEALAARHGARLRAADCPADTRAMTLELVWPATVEPPPWTTIRDDAAETFAWR